MKPHVWTNIAYLIAGCFLMASGLHIAGLGLLFLGYASWTGHSKGGKWWYLDWAGMYVSFVAVLAQNTGIEWLIAITPIVVWLTMSYRFDSVMLTGVLFSLSLLSAYHAQTYPVVAASMFTAAIIMRQQTSDNAPDYDFFHGFWHVLTAIGYVYLVLK